MSRFESAVLVVLENEGGYVNDPVDPGGATNWGVSLRWLRTLGDLDGDGYLDGDLDHDGDVDAEDIRNMSKANAVDLYRSQWWDRYQYDRIDTDMIATKVFDLAINMGARQAHLLLQRALRSTGASVIEDGILGPNSIAEINAADPIALLAAIRSEAAGFYRVLIAQDPIRNKYKRGWLKRAYS